MIFLSDWKCLCKKCGDEFIAYGEDPLTYVKNKNDDNIKKDEEEFIGEYENIKFIYYSFLNRYSLCDKCKDKLLPKLKEPEYVEMTIYPKLQEHALIEKLANEECKKEEYIFFKEIVAFYKKNELKLKRYEFAENDDLVRIKSSFSEDVKIKRPRKKLVDFMEDEMDKCERLHNILEMGKTFGVENYTLKNALPDFGVYIFYEKGEFAFGGNRIVRIGITKGYYDDVTGKVKGKTLHDRIKTHYFGKKGSSVFRRKLGETFINCDENLDANEKAEAIKKWNTKGVAGDPEIEKKVSNRMAENMTFKVIKVDDLNKRLELEKRLIGTVSNCKNCQPSEGWFGKTSPKEKVIKSGLWQEEHLLGNGLEEKDLIDIKEGVI